MRTEELRVQRFWRLSDLTQICALVEANLKNRTHSLV